MLSLVNPLARAAPFAAGGVVVALTENSTGNRRLDRWPKRSKDYPYNGGGGGGGGNCNVDR